MSKWGNIDSAKADAKLKMACVGFCVFDGMFYVGTWEQLEKIGCIDIAEARYDFQ